LLGNVGLARTFTASETPCSSTIVSVGEKTAGCLPASFGSGWFPELIPFAARLYSRLLWWSTSDIFRKYFKIDKARGPVILGFV
ncbi:MAG TPA: hypothetical protein VMT78_12100, partial [Terriglobia bacterium]|nr:hypothetical protein [Terriglobia bacterium]